MYKMIVVDLDGTLLNDAKKVSKENSDLIKRAYEEKGIITVIATGRPLGYAKEICELYGDYFANYIISSNGATVKNIKTNEYIENITFTDEEVLALRNIYLEGKADCMIACTDTQFMAETRNNESFKDTGLTSNTKENKVQSIQDGIKNNSNKVKACIIRGENPVLERITEKINKLEGIEIPVLCSYLFKTKENIFETKYIDISKSSKKNAIHILADKLGIKQEEIIVMGDGRKRYINV